MLVGFFCFMEYYLYILRSEVKETYYIGLSNNPERRLHFHNTDDRKAKKLKELFLILLILA